LLHKIFLHSSMAEEDLMLHIFLVSGAASHVDNKRNTWGVSLSFFLTFCLTCSTSMLCNCAPKTCCCPPYTATLVWKHAFKEPDEWRILFALAWYADKCNVFENNYQAQLYRLECEVTSRHHPRFRIQLSQFSRLKAAKGNHNKSRASEKFRCSSASEQIQISHVCGAKFVHRVQ
jgi:hypothetical protein